MSNEPDHQVLGRSLARQGLLDAAWCQSAQHSDLVVPDYKEAFLLIMRVWVEEPTKCSMTAVADLVRERLKVDAKTATAKIKRLIDMGLFTTIASEFDRRRILLIPTQDALRTVARYDVASDAIDQMPRTAETLSRRA